MSAITTDSVAARYLFYPSNSHGLLEIGFPDLEIFKFEESLQSDQTLMFSSDETASAW